MIHHTTTGARDEWNFPKKGQAPKLLIISA